MSNLSSFFNPKVIAVAGDDPAGVRMLRHLRAGEHSAAVRHVQPAPRKDALLTVEAWVAALNGDSAKPELVIVAAGSSQTPVVAEACGRCGIPAVLLLRPTVDQAASDPADPIDPATLSAALRQVRKNHPALRMLGPESVGLMVPGLGLNASLLPQLPPAGRLALVTQSGAVAASVVDWAAGRGIGFSHVVSVGRMAEVQFAHLIDHFAQDARVGALLLHIESIRDARAFVSAARNFTRSKPLIACKAGRFDALDYTTSAAQPGRLIGGDEVHDAAFRRCGIERVESIDDLFDCAALLGRHAPLRRGRVLIVSTGGGPAAMAADALRAAGGQQASLSEPTLQALSPHTAGPCSAGQPIQLASPVSSPALALVLKQTLADEQVDALLLIVSPPLTDDAPDLADTIRQAAATTSKPLLTACLGGPAAEHLKHTLAAAELPVYASPERAIRALMHLVSYAQKLSTLYETPLPSPPDLLFNRDRGGRFVDSVLSRKNAALTEVDAKSLLDAYGITVARASPARTANEAARCAARIGYPVTMKILSAEVTRKSDVGGVRHHLPDDAAVRQSFGELLSQVAAAAPDAALQGVTIQSTIDRTDAVELMLGSFKDPVFGSVMVVGLGGTTAEVLRDRVVVLPTLTEALARQTLQQLRIWPLLAGLAGQPAVDLAKLTDAMIRFSYLIADSPNLCQLEVNPLLASARGVVALDARGRTDAGPINADARFSHLAVRPYPADYHDQVHLDDGTLIDLRPIKPSDEALWRAMLQRCSVETIRSRFFNVVKQFSHEMAVRYCFTDYDRELAIVALTQEATGPRMLGICRLVADADRSTAEFALFVEDAWQSRRIGSLLTHYSLQVARSFGLQKLTASTMPDNRRMLATFRDLGFTLRPDADDEVVYAELNLNP